MDWQPIETAPKDGTLFLATNSDPARQNPCVIYWDRGSVAFDIIGHWRASTHEARLLDAFTHWMPLPEPPTASQ